MISNPQTTPTAPIRAAPIATLRPPSVRSLLLRFAAVAFVVVGSGVLLGKLAVDAVIARVEQEAVLDQVTRTRFAFDRIARRAKRQVEDYAFWDETVRLAQKPEASEALGFFRRNFVDWLPRNDYDFIELLDGARSNAFDWTASSAVIQPAMATSEAFLDTLVSAGSVGGYVYESDSLYLIGGAAVYPSLRSPSAALGRPRGFLVIGKAMQRLALDSLASELQLAVRILPGPPMDPPISTGPTEPGAQNRKPPAVPSEAEVEHVAGGDSVRTYVDIGGMIGDRVARVEIRSSRTQLRRISRWTTWGAILGLVVGGLAFLLVWRHGRRLLITPLRGLVREIESMHSRGELASVTSAAPSEEWELFLSTFNTTVQSLRDSEQRYSVLFDHAADPYLLLDRKTMVVVDANPAAAALVGEARTRLVGQGISACLGVSTPLSDTIRLRRPDGTVRTWGVVTTDVTIGDRQLVLAAFRDLTDRDALAQTQKMDAIGSLAGGIAHDFNNLMAAVLAGARVARTAKPSSAESVAALDAIEHAGGRAADLTRQLLGVSRHEPVERVRVDVAAAIATVRRICASTFDPRIVVVVQVPGDLRPVEGDPGQIEQALLNLCINARDAMPSGGTLRISARNEVLDADGAFAIRDVQPGPYVVLGVEDNGVGMSDAVKQRIFEPFFTTKARGRGTGLGLAMVYGLARTAGGTIVVESTLDKGSRFTLYLPAAKPGTPPPREPVLTPASVRRDSTLPRATLLLADDEAELRGMLRLVLEEEGYEVLEAGTGADAVQLFRQHASNVCAVLLDVQMPVLGGLEACREIHAIAPDVPVILGTGYLGDAELDALRTSGADDLLLKPYDIPALLERLARLARLSARA